MKNEDYYLDSLLILKIGNTDGLYRVKDRKCYADTKGKQVHPLGGTIFSKSETPLSKWFKAISALSQNMETSVMELHKEIGTTYKAAWCMKRRIQNLRKKEPILFNTYVLIA